MKYDDIIYAVVFFYRIFKEKLIKDLSGLHIRTDKIKDLKKKIQKELDKSLVHPGEAVGIITAQSIGAARARMLLQLFFVSQKIIIITGERQTQMTLNTFHQVTKKKLCYFFHRNVTKIYNCSGRKHHRNCGFWCPEI